MNTEEIIQSLNLMPSREEKVKLKKEIDIFCKIIKETIKNKKINAEIFVGGSFAKDTFIKKDKYEADIFIRFLEDKKELSKELEKIVKIVSKKIKIIYEKVHGSRDYFRFQTKDIIFELIPVIKIKKPQEAKNITDLSYFHVNYVKKNIDDKKIKEIIIAKAFFKSCGVYGAESYIQGFSGYALECLIIYYKNFDKMIKDFIKKENITLDIEKYYKNQNEIKILLNESKAKGPIILIDPTWKERNVLAALSRESYNKIRETAKNYLTNKKIDYFIEKEFNIEEFKKKVRGDYEFLRITLQTDKQQGDIAGTKMKKFYKFIKEEISDSFEIIDSNFEYYNKDESDIFLIVKNRKEIIRKGPPIKLIEAVKNFKEANENTFEKEGNVYAKIKIDNEIKEFFKNWMIKYSKKIKEMDITNIKLNQ